MTDWADKKAMELLAPGMGVDDVRDVAEALRQARIDALEEAARCAEELAAQSTKTHENPFAEIAAAIRALKDKQP